VLKRNGTFWLAIGDDYAAELKLESHKAGFHCRSWVVWYYTFGVNCTRKFTRSHTHLFHFVRDPKDFTFRDDDLDNRIPSARELVYSDRRANPKGRLPDDTWIIRPADAVGELTCDEDGSQVMPPADVDRTFTLRPQDLDQRFKPDENTWYFPRVAGTFRERAGFHGCQMPEQLLGRIIRACSCRGEIVLDPFAGSGTTLAVAKKLDRRYIGYELSAEYARLIKERLRTIRAGDALDGAPEPLVSAPTTAAGRRLDTRIHGQQTRRPRKASTQQKSLPGLD
jgi:site-specific DNA-methyltransferase (adenine-specific)